MKLGIRNIIVMLIVLLSACAFANEERKPKINPEVDPSVLSEEEYALHFTTAEYLRLLNAKSKDEQAIQLLKNQLEMQENFNERILNTVYWFLGTTTALFALMLGAGWFGTYRDNKKNQELLKNYIDERYTAKTTQLKAFIDLLEADKFKSIESKIAESSVAAEKTRKRFDVQMRNQGVQLRNGFLKIEYEKWINKKIGSNALSCAAQILSNALDIEDEYEILDALDLIQETFKDPILRTEVDSQTSSDLMSALRRLPENHHATRDAIIATVSSVNKKVLNRQ